MVMPYTRIGQYCDFFPQCISKFCNRNKLLKKDKVKILTEFIVHLIEELQINDQKKKCNENSIGYIQSGI